MGLECSHVIRDCPLPKLQYPLSRCQAFSNVQMPFVFSQLLEAFASFITQ